MPYKCMIVDDEPPAQRVVERYLNDIPDMVLVAKCHDAFEASEILRKQPIDIVFLDINMPKMTGLDFIKTLQNPPQIIITSAYREYALEGFDLNAADYLKKPFSFERFFRAVNKAIERMERIRTQSVVVEDPKRIKSTPEFLFVKEDKVTHKVNCNDILFIESVSDYNKIVTVKKIYLIYQTLRKLQEILPTESFPRIHKSYIISLSKIDTIVGNRVKVNDYILPIGQTYRDRFFKLLEK